MKEDKYINSINDETLAKYLSGELDEKQIEQIESEIMKNAEKEQEMRELSQLWEKAARVGDYEKINVDADWTAVKTRMGFRKSKKIPFVKYFARIAAILVLAIGLAYLLNQVMDKVNVAEQSSFIKLAAKDELREVVLPDKTIVTLNRNSSLTYNDNYGLENRDIILAGEAFFDVERNEDIPFKVFVDNSVVEVLGTSFNIHQSKNNIKVGVVSGHVLVYESDKKDNHVDLVKDEQTLYNKSTHEFSAKDALDENSIAWKTGILSFDGESFEFVFETIAEFFGYDLQLNISLNEKISQVNLPASSLNETLENLESTIKLEYNMEIKGKKLIISD
ncbi:MAG: FecR domain-containing protein [Bacteroidales bacterium]|nr:FecR domain-containing protein [Bacteroidales bacterium]MBN2818618.1 FecR domain-containing protein [Bacteroidales bacterium]